MQGVLSDQSEVLRLGIDIPQGVFQERESQYSYFLIHDGIRKGVRLVFWPPWWDDAITLTEILKGASHVRVILLKKM